MGCDNSNQPNSGSNNKNEFGFFSIPPEQFTLLASVVGFLLAENLDANEQNSLGNFLTLVGQVLMTVASQKALLDSGNDNQQILQRLNYLKKHISEIEQELEGNT
ncbi:hypothetical protein DFR58_109121 [Anaerobacterium chartisolvens]|uniref:Uncharacterized protein n=1 Tax=Anaerobacterium chartisolvens TaxID=1297424 RepID=A0A369BB43_9FIRM|nr:hypothetical protein [Anaerobacterium chartisolvens]RCX16894.1 hypothetical protein DFR58_109121 [Anaerobacterium chartisolvens]